MDLLYCGYDTFWENFRSGTIEYQHHILLDDLYLEFPFERIGEIVDYHCVVSTGKPAYQSTTYSSDGILYDAGLAVNGNNNKNFNYGSCSRTVVSGNQNPYWYVDLSDLHRITNIRIYTAYGFEVSNFGMDVYVVNSTDSPLDASNQYESIDSLSTNNYHSWYQDVIGRFVFLFQRRSNEIVVCEVYVYGTPLSPVLTCLDRDVVGPSPSIVTWDLPTVTDDRDSDLKVTCNPPSGSSFTADSTTVTCAATDSTDITAFCTFNIQFIALDDENPTVVCPSARYAYLEFTTVTWDDPSVSDNVDTDLSATCTPPSGSSFNNDSTIVNCTATDTAGNTGTCGFTVYYFIDIFSPTVICPIDIKKNTTTSQTSVTWNDPSVSDHNDPGLSATCTPPSGSSFNIGSTYVTCNATDTAGNTGICGFKVTVNDNRDVDDKIRFTVSNQTTVTWDDPSDLSVTCDPPSGSSFNIGSTDVTCSTMDMAGNTGSCNFIIFVIDIYHPIVACPANINKDTDAANTTVTWDDPSVIDNVDTGLSATCTPPSGSSFDVGLTDVTCFATDTAGNTGSCIFNVSVNDAGDPTVNCPDDIEGYTVLDQLTVTWNETLPVSDNADTDLSATCTPPSGSSFNAGSTDVTCTAMDTDSNTGSCQFTVFVIDIDVPVVTCPSNKEEDTKKDQVTMTWNDPSVTDNIDTGLSATCTPPSGSSFNAGSTVVTCTAMDTTGNTGSCGFNVTINGKVNFDLLGSNY
ncbi:hyalin-like [Antedon mediterranea]|uniref:hyalin-like n=1 Tax=Antedon mediterranea TaxID=105859 RepID=UPI003AF8A295